MLLRNFYCYSFLVSGLLFGSLLGKVLLPKPKALGTTQASQVALATLNEVLKLQANVVILMDMTASRAAATLKLLEKGQFATVSAMHERIAHIVQPLTEFFDHVKKEKSMVQPLLQDCLESAFGSSYINSVIESPLGVTDCLKNKVATTEQFEELCGELVLFFKDLHKSYTPEVEAAKKVAFAKMRAKVA